MTFFITYSKCLHILSATINSSQQSWYEISFYFFPSSSRPVASIFATVCASWSGQDCERQHKEQNRVEASISRREKSRYQEQSRDRNINNRTEVSLSRSWQRCRYQWQSRNVYIYINRTKKRCQYQELNRDIDIKNRAELSLSRTDQRCQYKEQSRDVNRKNKTEQRH